MELLVDKTQQEIIKSRILRVSTLLQSHVRKNKIISKIYN